MELFFEYRPEYKSIQGKLYFFQAQPALDDQPVLHGDSFVDAAGASIYGSVIQDSGRFRMWYQAWPKDWDGKDVSNVGYAESDDGVNWTKPTLKLVDYHGDGKANNLVDMGVHSPSVFIDTNAPASHRYRATGYCGKHYGGHHPDVGETGYYTLHSPDGLHWNLDQTAPQWPSGDVITTTYHPTQQRAITSLKVTPRYNKIPRRAIWQAQFRDGQYSPAHAALVPDEFDDVCAIRHGCVTGDYYGMAMMPAGSGTVGFIWQFRHDLPHGGAGVFGKVDLSLAYQHAPGHCWFHIPGRPNFITHKQVEWLGNCVYTSAAPIEVGNEQWLYLCGAKKSHGWYLSPQWKVDEKRRDQLIQQGFSVIGRARWPKDRLFGYHGDPEAILELNLGKITKPVRLHLNYAAEPTGHIRAACPDDPKRSLENAHPLDSDQFSQPVAWKDTDIITPDDPARDRVVQLHLDCVRLYAYEIVPV